VHFIEKKVLQLFKLAIKLVELVVKRKSTSPKWQKVLIFSF